MVDSRMVDLTHIQSSKIYNVRNISKPYHFETPLGRAGLDPGPGMASVQKQCMSAWARDIRFLDFGIHIRIDTAEMEQVGNPKCPTSDI